MTQHLVPDGKPPFRVAGHADATVIDDAGNRYLDFTSGWCVANLGWNNPALETQLPEFDGPDFVSPNHDYAGWEAYAALLADVAPGNLTRCFRATGGSEAVDLALQAARLQTGRRRVLSLKGSYHGNTLATLDAADGPIKPPLDERALERVAQRLEKETYSAFLFEPIAINLGVVIPEPAFVRGLKRVCRDTGTLIVADNVIRNGGGRASDDAVRSLALGRAMLGIQAALVIHHTKCRLRGHDAASLRAALSNAGGEVPAGFDLLQGDVPTARNQPPCYQVDSITLATGGGIDSQ